MTAHVAPPTKRQAWNALEVHYRKVQALHLRTLFADDPKRGERMTAQAVGIYLDYSKKPRHRRDPHAPPSTGRGIRPPG
jgi:glucose-6-phosphate isomerase